MFKGILREICAYPMYLMYVALRVMSRLLVGKRRRDQYFTLQPSKFVFFNSVKKTTDGLFFYLRKQGDELCLCESSFEPEVRKILQPERDEVVMDVGAHIGTYTIRLARHAKLVVAVEPHPSNFEVLKINTKLNGLKNILALNVGLASRNHTMYLESKSEYGWTRLRETGKNPVEVYSLDNLLEKLGVDKVDWIKIDSEGMELDILHGASRALAAHNPRLVIEIHRDREAILKLLDEKGFRVKALNTNHVFAFKDPTQSNDSSGALETSQGNRGGRNSILGLA